MFYLKLVMNKFNITLQDISFNSSQLQKSFLFYTQNKEDHKTLQKNPILKLCDYIYTPDYSKDIKDIGNKAKVIRTYLGTIFNRQMVSEEK